jgi:hypothetical protein
MKEIGDGFWYKIKFYTYSNIIIRRKQLILQGKHL